MSDLAVSLPVSETPQRATVRPMRIAHDALGGRIWLGAVVGAVAGATLVGTSPLHWQLCLALGLVVGVLVWIIDGGRIAARTLRVEAQLADALDLLASGVAVGLSLVEALEGAARESRAPLRPVLLEATGRLRLGDQPARVFADTKDLLPLSSMRLLMQFLTAQWQSGGSLGPGITAIATTVRDRIALSRRIQGQSAEARFSVFGIVLVIYGIAALAWLNNQSKVEAFMGSEVGGGLTALCVVLQAAGLIWMARLTRIST